MSRTMLNSNYIKLGDLLNIYNTLEKLAVDNNLQVYAPETVLAPLVLTDIKVDDEGVEHNYSYALAFSWYEIIAKYGMPVLNLSNISYKVDLWDTVLTAYYEDSTNASKWTNVLSLFTGSNNILKQLLDIYCKSYFYKWAHMFESMNTYFNPLYNVDGTEILTDDIAKVTATSDIAELQVDYDSAVKTNTRQEPPSVVDERDTATYDDETFYNKERNTHTVNGNTTITDDAYTDTTTTHSHTDTVTTEKDGVDTHTTVRKGNIGVTMSTTLLFDYRRYSNISILDIIMSDLFRNIGGGMFYDDDTEDYSSSFCNRFLHRITH